MAEYEEIAGEVEVPKNAGIKGFLKTIEDLLKLPRVQSVNIDARGKVEYRRFVREGEPQKPFEVDFGPLLPYAIIRNAGKVSELGDPDLNAAVALGQLFDMAARDHLFPIAFAGGANSIVWDWYETTTSISLLSREELYGLPFLTDRMIEDHVVILCAAYARTGAMIDTQRSYKLAIPQVPA